jgi:hypothetical protein
MHHARTIDRKNLLTLGLAAAALALLLAPRASHAMTISPPVLDVTLNPGDVLSDVVQIYNEEDVPFKVTPHVVNFYQKAGDETSGSPEFYPADQVKNGYELAPWIVLKSEATVVQPHERVNFPIDIKVPKDAQPGSHFGAVQILAGNPGESPDAAVAIERGTSVLVFVRVSGNARDEMSVSRFAGDKQAYSHLPVDFHIRLDNTGTTHLRPTGDIFVKDMFGRQVAAVLVNPGPDFKSVLPGTSRRFDVDWIRRKLPEGTSEYWQQIKNFGFGKYDATLVLNYGPDNKLLTATWSFWVLPWLAIATVIGAVLLVVLVLVFGLRGYNHLVIRRYEAKRKQQNS